jgi:tetratricopeptide (TPR) repeat protein
MNTTFFLKSDRLSLLHPDWSRESFEVKVEDVELLEKLAAQYQQALAHRDDNQQNLLEIGTELGHWLNRSGWLERLLDEVDAPWAVVFQVPRRPKAAETAWLNAPWELLAWEKVHLAIDIDVRFNPVRQIGEAKNTLEPSPYRLGLMFMAAAPEQVTTLSYESEELAILDATQDRDLELTVEETGTLEELAVEVARYQPDVIHISCHGGFDAQKNPVLLLEDEEGQRAEMSAADWLGRPTLSNIEQGIKLAFISACHTANPSPQVADSLATQLIKGGMPAVLGWGNTVSDVEATQFAQYFYQFVAQRQSLSQAVGAARWQLFIHCQPKSRDWHLARLFIGRYQIGALTDGDQARRLLDAEFGAKAFLDKQKQVPVAGRAEFVGRRRSLQAIIREFRRPQYAGVLIHGMGRQGKSSLAARVARRLVNYTTVVVYGHYEAVDILLAFKDLSPTINSIVNAYETKVHTNPGLLTEALQQLLCEQEKPILLVIDDLEQVLEPPKETDGLYTVRADLQIGMRALLSSFARWSGQSHARLLLTSRYRFFIAGDQGENLADKLLQWPLAPMDTGEQRKQLEQKQRYLNHLEKRSFKQHAYLQKRCLQLASGNPGLQDQLYRLIRQDAKVAEQTLDEVAVWLNNGTTTIQEESTRDLLEGLVLDKLYQLLSTEAQQLLHWSQDFVMPLPIVALNQLATAEAVQALLTLGLWDGWRDEITLQPAAMLNRLAKRLCQDLETNQLPEIAEKLLSPLWTVWQAAERSDQADYQLTRLAVRVAETAILEQVAGNGVRWTTEKVSFTEGKALGMQAIEQLEAAGLTPDDLLLRYSAESCRRVGAEGDVDKALALHQRRLEILPTDKEWERAVAYAGIADILQARGQLDEALRIYQKEVLPAFERLGEIQQCAVIQGRIANILQARGQLDEALRIRQEEQLPVYERLGEVHSRAVTMGKIADILQARGQLDEALRIRQEEELPVYERLGDVRERAVTMGKIADILQARGQLDEALRIRQEEQLPVYERLGDVRSRAVTMGKIADILQARGQLDEALRIRQEEQLPVFERLGEVRSRAVTMGQIADILQARGQLDEALRIRQEEQLPVYERLGDVRLRAVTMGQIADILQARGQVDEALRIRQEEQLPVYERLGEVRSILVAQTKIAIIFMQLEPPRRNEANQLLCQALHAAQQMRIPEAGQIEAILQGFEMEC